MSKGLIIVDIGGITGDDQARLEAAGYMVITKARGSDLQVIRSPYPSAMTAMPWNDPEVNRAGAK